MPKSPTKTEQKRAAILEALYDGPKTIIVLSKECGKVTEGMINSMLRASTVERIVGGLQITEDGKVLVRLARKKAASAQ